MKIRLKLLIKNKQMCGLRIIKQTHIIHLAKRKMSSLKVNNIQL